MIRDQVYIRVEPLVAVRITKQELTDFVIKLVGEIANERKILLNADEQHVLGANIVDEMVGLGPIDPLLRDPTVSDILVNGARMIYVERRGKLELSNLQFRSDAQVLHVAQRIASSIGRRVDESSPMLDARLADGSRVNVDHPAAQPEEARACPSASSPAACSISRASWPPAAFRASLRASWRSSRTAV